VVTLLSESQWQGVKLKGAVRGAARFRMPIASRSTGPTSPSARGPRQSLSLLFFELASHSDEGLSLVGKQPAHRRQLAGQRREAPQDQRER